MPQEPTQDLTRIVGKHWIYIYDSGWQYEIYVKNAHTIDYRIHTGMVGGRWVKDQQVRLNQFDGETYKISWTEPTGTSVSLLVNLPLRRQHGTAFFPDWVHQHPERTVGFQNQQLDQLHAYRAAGPTYPLFMVDDFAAITYVEDAGVDDETVIDRPPDQLPAGYADRTNPALDEAAGR